MAVVTRSLLEAISSQFVMMRSFLNYLHTGFISMALPRKGARYKDEVKQLLFRRLRGLLRQA